MNETMQQAKVAEEKHVERQQIVVFRLGEEEYGLSIDQIKEVVITPNITRMPQTPDFIKGVANIRGNVIAILDLEIKFGINRQESAVGKTYTLVIESDEYKMGIIVKEVPNTLSIPMTSLENSVFMGDQDNSQSYMQGIVKLDNRLIIMIDALSIITEKESKQIFSSQL